MIYQKELPVRLEADVVVAGGGASGVAAAVAAARMGKSVLLAEAGGALGGVGTSGLVPENKIFPLRDIGLLVLQITMQASLGELKKRFLPIPITHSIKSRLIRFARISCSSLRNKTP